MSITTEERQGTGWTADASTFGARLALIRQRMGWGNIAKAARACDLPVDTWRNWETGVSEPLRLTTIAKQIVGATGCDYLWLVHGPGRGDGGGLPTREYLPGERVIATIGDPNRTRRTIPRSVRRTRPIDTRSIRPLTPLPV